MNSKVMTRGALTIALICVFFTVFKGTTNIINALLVPLALYICLVNEKGKAIVVVFGATLIMCLILFKLQIIFVCFYCLITRLLLMIHHKGWSYLTSVLIISMAFFLSFWISIWVTDYIFLTRMNEIMLRLFDHNYLKYLLVLLIESAVVGMSLLSITHMIHKRFKTIIE